jgi:hypothetical protein
MLIWIAKDLAGKPITEHSLFTDQKGTYLDDYTVEFTSFQHDPDNLWKDVLKHQHTDTIILPPDNKHPSLFGLLKCIKGTPSFSLHGCHTIPFTAGCATHQPSLLDAYLDNVKSTDLRQSFAGQIVNSDQRNETMELINETFGPGNQRALQISFLYNPFKKEKKQKHLDKHTTGIPQNKYNY